MTPLLLFSLVFATHFPQTRGNPTLAVSSIVYAVNRGTLYRSDHAGATFTARGSVVGTYVVVDPANARIVYDVGGLRRSDDGGATWTPFGGGAAFGTELKIDPSNPSDLYLFGFCSTSHPANAGLFVSHDRGATWQQQTSDCTLGLSIDPLPPHTMYRAGIFHSGSGLPTRQIVGNAPFVRYGLDTFDTHAILFSTNGAISWQSRAMADQVFQLALDGDRLFAATSSGLLLSTDGAQTWQTVVRGPVMSVVIAGDLLYISTPRGWSRAPLATPAAFAPLAPLPSVPTSVRGLAGDPHATRLYATADVVDAESGALLGTVWRSDDGGERWAPVSGDDTKSRYEIAVDGAGDVYAFDDSRVSDLFHYDAATGRSEHYSTNFDLTPVRTLWADPHRHGTLYTVNNGLLYTSADGGHAWSLVSSLNDGTKWIAVLSLSFEPNRKDVIYASTDAGVFRSLDGGATWSLFDAAAPLSGPRFAFDPLNDRSVWRASDRNLDHSADGGATWTLEATFARPIHAVVIDRDGMHIHVALDPDATPGELDATIRSERRRAAGR